MKNKSKLSLSSEHGFVMLPVIVTMLVIALLAFVMNRESGMNAAEVGGQAASEQTRLLAEAGLQHAQWTADNSMCTGYSLSVTDFGEEGHTYSASFTPTSGSPVTITATGIHDSGISQSLIRSEQKIFESPTTFELQPDAAEGKDAWYTQIKPGWNYGAHLNLRMYEGSGQRSVVQFDTSAIPASAEILSASIELYAVTSGTLGDVAIHEMTREWQEGTCSGAGCVADGVTWDWSDGTTPWTSAGGDFNPVAAATNTITASGAWYQFDVRDLVSEWVAGKSNLGVLIKAVGSTNINFASSDYGDATLHPKFNVTYACECGGGASGTLTLQPGTSGLDTYIDDGNPTTNFASNSSIRLSSKTNAKKRGLVKFDTSSIASGVIITSAILEMNLEGIGSGGTASVNVHRATKPWLESQADWNNYTSSAAWTTAGGDWDSAVIDTAAIDEFAPGPTQWDVRSTVADWVDGTFPNEGLMLIGSDGVNHADFSTGDAADASTHPKLIINYSCPCGATCIAAPPPPPNIILSTMTEADLGGLSYTLNDLVEYDPNSLSATLFFDGAGLSFTDNIDALHVLANGHLLLSAISSTNLGGLSFGKDDLIDYDPLNDTASLIFNGSTLISGGNHDITSVYVKDDGKLILSDAVGGTLGGQTFTAQDLVEYDPATDTAILYFDGSALGLTKAITGVHLLDNGHILLATANASTLGGLSFDTYDLVDYDPVADTAVLYLDGLTAFGNNSEKIIAAHLGVGAGSLSTNSGPLAHWKLDDSSGTTALDSVGGHDGTLTNGPVWDAGGKINGALDFDGADDHILVPHSADLAITDKITITAWVNNQDSSLSRFYRVISKEQNGQFDAYWVSITPTALAVGIGGTIFTTPITMATDQWYHLAFSFDDDADELKLYFDGVLMKTESTTVTLNANTADVQIGNSWQGTKGWDGLLDDVRIYDYVLGATDISDLFVAGGGGGGGGGGTPGYVEMYQAWSASADNVWQSVDLGAFGVPANAVVEVGIVNAKDKNERSGGVRAVGSTLERRLSLHEAEDGGTDTVTMHVQADASSTIEHYSAKKGELTFVLLGYWTGASYVEKWQNFSAGSSGSWVNHSLSAYGVPADSIAEVVVVNNSTGAEYWGGVRGGDSGVTRYINLHEAEQGGVDASSGFANVNASAEVQVFSQSNSNVDFYLMGYFSVAPGSYTEAGIYGGKPGTGSSWQTTSLAGFGVPADSIVSFVIGNAQEDAEANLGVRAVGSGLQRVLDLQEAESGGYDIGSMHVKVDASSQIQWYDENTQAHEFFLVGWWVLAP